MLCIFCFTCWEQKLFVETIIIRPAKLKRSLIHNKKSEVLICLLSEHFLFCYVMLLCSRRVFQIITSRFVPIIFHLLKGGKKEEEKSLRETTLSCIITIIVHIQFIEQGAWEFDGSSLTQQEADWLRNVKTFIKAPAHMLFREQTDKRRGSCDNACRQDGDMLWKGGRDGSQMAGWHSSDWGSILTTVSELPLKPVYI